MEPHEVRTVLGILQDHVIKHYEDNQYPEDWCNLPEIPSKVEIMPKPVDRKQDVEQWDDYQKDPVYDPKLPINIVNGPWSDKMKYLGAHYQILREDAIAPLRKSVDYFCKHQQMYDSEETYVYSDVYVKGLVLSAIGPAFRFSFATDPLGKRVRWEASKRLQQGTLVALSTERDMFSSICKISTIAARPLSGLMKNPPEVDIFFGDITDAIIDPSEKYVMIEARTGYFEASRHMLVAMQKLPHERFQLQDHLVQLDTNIGPPKHLECNPIMDLNSLARPKDENEDFDNDESLENINALNTFPVIPQSGMDVSQMEACGRMVTKKLAIVQGPPGTGKTYTSIKALRALIENSEPGGPPIIIAAQTNHALDQLLNHVLDFEPGILRLGGRSAFENTIIRTRTLHELRLSKGQEVPSGHKGLKYAQKDLQVVVDRVKTTMAPLLTENLLSELYLLREGLINQAQYDSLHETGWATAKSINGVDIAKVTKIEEWLGQGQLMPIPCTPQVNFGLQMEPEYDEELEDQDQMEIDHELEGRVGDMSEREIDALLGEQVMYGRKYTGNISAATSTEKVRKLLKKKTNLYDIPDALRGSVYRYWEKQIDAKIQEEVVSILRESYAKVVRDTKITKWLCNIRLINHLRIKVVGCTTTGLAKYRGLISAIQPHTLLIEEAAETLEGTVIAGMFDSLERLILVGDHKQLQAHCNIRALEVEPYYLNVSMFERLINNGIPYTMLNEQRRMITDVRELLCIEPKPFYKGLHDHPSVLDRKENRPRIPGMGGRDVYFFHHNWPETRNEDFSVVNTDEAQMIAGFFKYLTLNGTPTAKITVLSFYTGQKKKILSTLKEKDCMGRDQYLNVHTVDSFQGEENDVILLSLVRSNTNLSIGFLESQNRLVVALSRARRGLYIFGNLVTLVGREGSYDGRLGISRDPLWGPLMEHMGVNGQLNIDGGLPITCENHNTTVVINEANDWSFITAGCTKKCPGKLPCGHDCPYLCHNFKHEDVICKVPCPRKVPACGHGCSRDCGEQCHCARCTMHDQTLPIHRFVAHRDEEEAQLAALAFRGHQSLSVSSEILSPSKSMSRFPSEDIRDEATIISDDQWPANFIPARRNNSFERGRLPFGSPSSNNNSPPRIQGSVEKWREWDPRKTDIAAIEEQRAQDAAAPKLKNSQTVFNETFRQIKAHDGVRTKGATVRKLVGRKTSADSDAFNVRTGGVYGIAGVDTKPGNSEGRAENHPRMAHRITYPQATLTPVDSILKPIDLISSSLLETGPLIAQALPKSSAEQLEGHGIEDNDPFGMGFDNLAITPRSNTTSAQAMQTSSSGLIDLMLFDDKGRTVMAAIEGEEEELIKF